MRRVVLSAVWACAQGSVLSEFDSHVVVTLRATEPLSRVTIESASDDDVRLEMSLVRDVSAFHPNYKEVARNRELKRIQNENQAILKRIMEQANKKSAYDKKSQDEDWQKTQRYRELASNYTPPMKQKRKMRLAESPRPTELEL